MPPTPAIIRRERSGGRSASRTLLSSASSPHDDVSTHETDDSGRDSQEVARREYIRRLLPEAPRTNAEQSGAGAAALALIINGRLTVE